MGVRVGTYPDGNDAAKTVMEDVMTNLVGDVSVLIPRQVGESRDAYSIEVQEPNASQAKVFADLIEGYLAGQIRNLIIGQSATTEAVSTGMGSSVADQHALTFRRIIEADARNLADTLTTELVWKYHEMNFGETDWRPKWSFSLEKTEPQEFMQSMEAFVNLGGAVSQRQAREILGITEPEEGEAILEAQQEPGMEGGEPGGEGDFLSQMLGGGAPSKNAGGEIAEQAYRRFREQAKAHYNRSDGERE